MKGVKFSGDGEYNKKCTAWFNNHLNPSRALLTPSGTHALEMAVMLAGIGPGDEVIIPSYTFTSTATCVVMQGATPVFVDIRPDTMNIDEVLIEDAITERTRAIIPVHYGGVSCDMDHILEIAGRHKLVVIEDAAQGLMATYKGRHLGTMGDFGCLSFHETKNIQCGEGGALIINNMEYYERAEIIREKGTDRSKFWRGEIDKYSWIDAGSSYLISELSAAFLYAQLEMAEEITYHRLAIWEEYREGLSELCREYPLTMMQVPEGKIHNAHIFYLKTGTAALRDELIPELHRRGIWAVFHYVPLHSAAAGKKYGRFNGKDLYTSKDSARILRLPMYHCMDAKDTARVIEELRSTVPSLTG